MLPGHSLILGIYDLIPPLAFFVGAWFLVRYSASNGGRSCGILMAVGTGLVFLGGLLKALHKLVFVSSGGTIDIVVMSEIQFPLLAPEFLIILSAAVLLLRPKKVEPAVLPAVAPWKMPLMVLMVIGSIASMSVLALGARLKYPLYYALKLPLFAEDEP